LGVTPLDETFAELIRKRARRTLLVANKAEGRAGEAGALEAYALGLGDPISVSAEHGEGMEDLERALRPLVEEISARAEADAAAAIAAGGGDEEAAGGPEGPIQTAAVGRPNAGKSTLVNRLLGEERLLTGPEAGITRDAIGLELDWDGRRFRVFDT